MNEFITIGIGDPLSPECEEKTHAKGDSGGGYDTLCGLTAEDIEIDVRLLPTPKGKKIDCDMCKHNFYSWKKFNNSDFE